MAKCWRSSRWWWRRPRWWWASRSSWPSTGGGARSTSTKPGDSPDDRHHLHELARVDGHLADPRTPARRRSREPPPWTPAGALVRLARWVDRWDGLRHVGIRRPGLPLSAGGTPALHAASVRLDLGRSVLGRSRSPARCALRDDDPGHHRHRAPNPRLRDRLHGG